MLTQIFSIHIAQWRKGLQEFVHTSYLFIHVSTTCLSALTLLVGPQEGHLACKKWGDGGGGHWLVQMESHPAGLSVCLPLLIFAWTMKFRSSLLALADLCGPRKRAVKRLWWWSFQY